MKLLDQRLLNRTLLTIDGRALDMSIVDRYAAEPEILLIPVHVHALYLMWY